MLFIVYVEPALNIIVDGAAVSVKLFKTVMESMKAVDPAEFATVKLLKDDPFAVID